jgi:hypothetical protein
MKVPFGAHASGILPARSILPCVDLYSTHVARRLPAERAQALRQPQEPGVGDDTELGTQGTLQ